MEVILKKDVENLGYQDDMVDVKPGYARNFLVPRGLAVLATASQKKMLEETIRQRAHKEEKIQAEANAKAAKLENETIKIGAKVGENGKIFGSVNTIQLADALKEAGHEVDRKHIVIKNEPIKEIGTYEAEVTLHKDIKQTIKFEVVGE
ncbi:50S ribosomal protein L9 [Cryomorphaceae bacterium 1068]|jgi:large subunit ribosomal protein L9|nr:50S ribosomal protein L9 [Cryomorphaceae bacterium 1068]